MGKHVAASWVMIGLSVALFVSDRHPRKTQAAIAFPILAFAVYAHYAAFAEMAGAWNWGRSTSQLKGWINTLPWPVGGYDHGRAAWGLIAVVLNFGLVYLAYQMAYVTSSNALKECKREPRWFDFLRHIAWCAGTCLLIAWAAKEGYGTHIEDADPIWGGGTTVSDFVPTEQEKSDYGAGVLFNTLFPALLAVRNAIVQARRRNSQHRSVAKDDILAANPKK